MPLTPSSNKKTFGDGGENYVRVTREETFGDGGEALCTRVTQEGDRRHLEMEVAWAGTTGSCRKMLRTN